MASESQYHANISWAASMLYKLTGEQQYADEAVKPSATPCSASAPNR